MNIFRRIFGDTLPRTVDDIFRDFSIRRSAFLRAFTTDFDSFFAQCDPEKENLCLYGHATGRWEVNFPSDGLPPNLPQPTIGINFARDGMRRQVWLMFVAASSDSWLLAISSYFSASAGLNRDDRSRLFDLINDLPTLLEEVKSPQTQSMIKRAKYGDPGRKTRKNVTK